MLATRSGISRDTIVRILEYGKDTKYSTLDKIINRFYIDDKMVYESLNKPFIKEHSSYRDAGKRIKQLRIDDGLNQREFLDTCHIGHAALCRVENGKVKLSLITANKIAKGFKVDLDHLMYGFK